MAEGRAIDSASRSVADLWRQIVVGCQDIFLPPSEIRHHI
jgi:hypothetical protein